MAIQYTKYLIKTSTGTATVKTGINPNNPAEPPIIVDKNNNIIYSWDVTNKKWIPPQDPTGQGLLPSNGGFSSTETYGSILTQNEDTFTKNTVAVINKLPEDKKKLFQSSNSFKPYTDFANRSGTQNPTPTPGSDQKVTITEEDLNVKQILGNGRPSYDHLIYPTSLTENKQDYIKFTIIKYEASKLDKKNAANLKQKTYTNFLGSIILPIQPSISDSNVVDWGGKELSPVDIGLLSLSSAGMTGSVDQATDILSQLGDTVSKNEDVKKAIILKLKERALNVEGLLSRFGGAIVNPNLELLFQGPTLRPFNFTFRLSPRSEGEATQVRSIIRAFKEAMAPQVSNGGLFLATPRVFNISYHTPGKEMHPSINRIKTCALQVCNVDYTPDGSYMTFNDDNRTMTSYNLTLQFSELEPVTSKDYFDKNGPIPVDHIGY
jgi:hypothetical protein